MQHRGDCKFASRTLAPRVAAVLHKGLHLHSTPHALPQLQAKQSSPQYRISVSSLCTCCTVRVLRVPSQYAPQVAAGDFESTQCHLDGIIVRDRSVSTSNYRATTTLDDFCKAQNVIGIADVDTRQLTRLIRDAGCVNGVITDDSSKSDEELVAQAKVRSICDYA